MDLLLIQFIAKSHHWSNLLVQAAEQYSLGLVPAPEQYSLGLTQWLTSLPTNFQKHLLTTIFEVSALYKNGKVKRKKHIWLEEKVEDFKLTIGNEIEQYSEFKHFGFISNLNFTAESTIEDDLDKLRKTKVSK